MGWETYPEGIYDMLKQVQARNKGLPILILENGIGDRSDIDRQRYVQQYLQAVREAMSDGVDVRGYFYWTLLDNFEWDAGYAPKFGLYSVDFKTKARTLRPSGEWYKNVCEKKGFELKQ
jgi:beta-glucosidase